MNSVTLNNGVKMPLLGLGTWDLRGETCVETVRAALELGYRLVDTARMYGNEREVGEGLRRSGVSRSEVFVTTKLYRTADSYAKAKRDIDASLRALGLSCVDLLLVHEPYPSAAEMYRALEEALREGKARAIGVSNFDETRYAAFLKECGTVPAVNQLECHIYFQRWAFQERMAAEGTVLQAWSPLAQNIDGAANHPVLREIGAKYGKTAAQIGLRFLTQRDIPVIPKTKRPARLTENMALFDFRLSEEDMAVIRGLDRNDTLFPWTRAY